MLKKQFAVVNIKNFMIYKRGRNTLIIYLIKPVQIELNENQAGWHSSQYSGRLMGLTCFIMWACILVQSNTTLVIFVWKLLLRISDILF